MSGTQPFAFGHPFRQGDVPAGSVALGDSEDWQCTPLTYWPDGSLKHAIIAGRAAVTAGADTTINLTAGVNPGGALLTEASLASALPTTTIAIDGDVTTLNSLIGTGALHTTVCTGSVMSSWVYRRPVAGSSHLVVYAEVRLFKGGAVEIFPWIENGYLQVAGPTNFVRTCVVTINGAQRFSQSIDIKHHTRVPLISGSAFSYWVGVDPGITPAHDRAYLLSTKLIPNLGWQNPSATTLNSLVQTYVPNTIAGDDNASGGGGGSGCVIAPPSAFYVTSNADARAYKALMAHGLSSGSWSHHYRDATTNLPFRFSDWPNIRLKETDTSQSIPVMPVGSGGEVSGTGPYGGPAVTHTPGYAYFPFLVTGRWWFLEESQFWATYAYGCTNRIERGGAAGVHGSAQIRSRAWGLNVLGQTAAITPTSHPLHGQFVSSWQSNMAHHRARYVDGTTDGGRWVSPQGLLGEYSSDGNAAYMGETLTARNAWYGTAWMANYQAVVFGYSSDIGIPQSAQSLSDHLAVRNHAYKQQIGRAGDGLNGNYNWRRFIVYAYPFGSDATGLPVETQFTHAQSFAEMMIGFGLDPNLPATPGLTIKRTAGKDVGENDLGPGMASLDYGSTGIAALALAVEHGQPGAREGWNRITGASNFTNSFSAFLTDYRPHWGVLPR